VSPAGSGSSVDIVEVEFPPGGSVAFDVLQLAGSDQHVWVLEGTLELGLGEEVFRLEAGDCLMMRFDRPVVFRNPTEHQIRYAVIIGHGAERA
jgi:quercetin dioxygenase-like cupin family protein